MVEVYRDGRDSMFYQNPFETKLLLAHAYVPWQTYQKAYCPQEALQKGTLFPELWGVYKIPR